MGSLVARQGRMPCWAHFVHLRTYLFCARIGLAAFCLCLPELGLPGGTSGKAALIVSCVPLPEYLYTVPGRVAVLVRLVSANLEYPNAAIPEHVRG